MIPKYVKILNIAKFWIWHGCQYASITQRSEYARICFVRVLNISWVLNMPGYWIWQGSEYARVTHDSKYATIWLNRRTICLNMSEFSIIDTVVNVCHTIHMRSFNKLMTTYWDRRIQNPVKHLRSSALGKNYSF